MHGSYQKRITLFLSKQAAIETSLKEDQFIITVIEQ